MLGHPQPAPPPPSLDAFKARMAVLQSLPASSQGPEAAQLALSINPGLNVAVEPKLGPLEGRWTPSKLSLPSQDLTTQTAQHELSHDLGYRTGIGTTEAFGRGKGPYSQFGRVPREIAEGAADVISGTRGYLPDLSPAQRSQAKAVADMMLAAGKEQSPKELAMQIMKRKMK